MRFAVVLLFLALAACGGSSPPVTPQAIVDSFAAAGLPTDNISTEDVLIPEVQNSAATCNGLRFEVDADGNGMRVIICGNVRDAERVARYYTDLGDASPLLSSHAERRGTLILQGNGAISHDVWQQYVAALPDVGG